jgi:hypothetical protein
MSDEFPNKEGAHVKLNEAIMAFCQSEKIKSGILWVSQCIQLLEGIQEPERSGGERMVKVLLEMVLREVSLAETLAGAEEWGAARDHLERAAVMIHSGVAPECLHRLTQALSQVTNVGQRSMTQLKKQELL